MRHPPRLVVLLFGGLLAAASVLLPPRPQAVAASPACTVEYTVTSQWATGFQGQVKVTNNSAPMSGWRLGFDFPAGQRLTQGWSAQWSQSAGTTVTALNESWNGTLATGADATAGFLASWSGTNPAPTAFTLNGTLCNADPGSPQPPGAAPALKVSGNRLVDAGGTTRRLLGVNRSGAEFLCVQGYGIFDGPVDDASVKTMADWGANTVRIPLNEECWLGLDNVKSQYSGANYISAVQGLVQRVEAHGMTPLLDLHWTHGVYTGNSSGCADAHATCQKPMPDAQYAPAFWSSVARTFKADPAVVLDLFNEPYPDRATSDTAAAWRCWRDGGTCPGIGYEVAGMQDLLDAVRGTGATNTVLAGGLTYSNDLSQWLAYQPHDATGNLAAAWHGYNFNSCVSESCWSSTLAPVLARVPLVAGEIGENDCGHSYIDRAMAWLDGKGASYLGWAWNTWDCSTGPALITSYDGTPTAYGIGLRDHLRALTS
ncbi:cellulose binding domain-containing protein [Streptomyces sp. NPDC020719]|uniref:cellulose binding domain-containing protein n=1 Tax=Streptomyces sp. NPDC020719 TaxID=3154896 RepID=UPI0033FC0EAD